MPTPRTQEPPPVPTRVAGPGWRQRATASWFTAAALAVLAAASAGSIEPTAVPVAAQALAPVQSRAAAQQTPVQILPLGASNTPGTTPDGSGDPARCRWYAAAIRLAGSVEGELDPRAQRLRAELSRQGISADSPFPPECGAVEGGKQEEPGGTDPDRPSPRDEGPAPDDGVGRIALAADGNQHDQDDWASAPMTLAILAQRELQPNLVNYIFDNHIWDTAPEHRTNMTESVLGAGERFGFDTSRFYDGADPDGLAAGVAALTAEINASRPGHELTIVLAGPMETTWMALDAADPAARQNVRCVSHGDGSFNQTHGMTDHDGHSYDDVIDLGCQRVQIPDQNGNLGPTDMSDWAYLRDGDPAMDWLYSRIELAGKGDVSDAGMAYFVVTGEERVSRSELRSFLTGPPAAAPQAERPN